jgi:hypothetical protein
LPKEAEGVALWHFETDYPLKIKQDPRNFQGFLQPDRQDIRIINHDSLGDFEKDFTKMKKDHTLLGISVSSSTLSIYTGE